MTDLNQTALAAAKEVRGIASTEGIIRAYLDALPAAPLPEDVERAVDEVRRGLGEPPHAGKVMVIEGEAVADLLALITQQAQALADANARIREMEEAVEPFAGAYFSMNLGRRPDENPAFYYSARGFDEPAPVSVGDFRRCFQMMEDRR